MNLEIPLFALRSRQRDAKNLEMRHAEIQHLLTTDFLGALEGNLP